MFYTRDQLFISKMLDVFVLLTGTTETLARELTEFTVYNAIFMTECAGDHCFRHSAAVLLLLKLCTFDCL